MRVIFTLSADGPVVTLMSHRTRESAHAEFIEKVSDNPVPTVFEWSERKQEFIETK